MIHNQINGAPMPPEKINAYLKRIGMPAPESLDLSYLSRLQWAHMQHIPYENLDIMANKKTSLEREVLYGKMIRGSRGGVCSEINTLYNWLLESLGFEVVSYISRIIAKTLPIQPQSHRVMGVKLDGRIYLTDAGFNYEHHRIPLLLEENLVQSDGECEYKLVRDEFWGWVMWQNRTGHGWRRKLGFTEEPHIDLDFVPATFYAEAHPDSRINKGTKVSLYIDGCFYALRSGSFLKERGGVEEIIEADLTKEREKALLAEVFHL